MSKSNAGRSAHERHCKAEPTHPPAATPEPQEEPKEVVQTAMVIVKQQSGYKIVFDGMYHVEDRTGRVIGHFPELTEADAFLRGTLRFVR